MSAAPQQFEDFRKLLQSSVDQLLQEMQDQQVAYAVPAENVLELLHTVAALRNESPWDVWESWALRHALPIYRTLRAPRVYNDQIPQEQVEVLRKRLRDALGYCVLGLAMCEADLKRFATQVPK